MMKNIFKSSLLGLIGLFTFAGLTSCGGGNTEDPNKNKTNPVEELKLTEDFVQKDFLDDGIQEVEVDRISDGDTATLDGYTIRFFGINTPESTGQIEKWGKAASNFTKGKLNDAESIVIEGSNGVGQAPSTEGTGQRYLAYVWYKPTGANRYYNLNLELVYNGYSDSNIESDTKYFKYFETANQHAVANALNIHSQETDPLYDETLEVMDLRTISADPQKYDQAYVQVEAYVKSSVIGRNEIVIAQMIEGVEYEFTIYLGYETFPQEIIRAGNKVKFVARVNSHYDKWQLSGLEYSILDSNTSRVTCEGYRATFGQVENMNYGYSAIRVQNVVTEGDFAIVTGTTTNKRVNGSINVTVKVPAAAATSITVGSSLKCIAFNTSGTNFKPNAQEVSFEVLNAKDILK